MTAFMGRRALGASDRGFSVTEMAVVGAISSIMLLGSLNLAIHSQKRTSDIQSRLSESKLDMLILNSMSDSVCKGTFSGKKIGDPITKIKSAGKVCYDDTGTPSPNPNSCSTGFEAHCDTLQSPLKLCAAAADCGSGSHHCEGHETVFYDMSLKGGSFGNHFKAHHIKTAPLSPVTPGRAELQIFYSRPGANFERKDSSLPCSAADLRGCYKKTYTLKLSGTPTPSGAAGAPIGDCSLLTTGGGKHCIEVNCQASNYEKGIGIKRGPDCEHNGAHHDKIYRIPLKSAQYFHHYGRGQSFGKFDVCMLSNVDYRGHCRNNGGTCKVVRDGAGSWTGVIGWDYDGGCGGARCSAVCFSGKAAGAGVTTGCAKPDVFDFEASRDLGNYKFCALSNFDFRGACKSKNGKCELTKSGSFWKGKVGWNYHGGCGGARCSAVCLPGSSSGGESVEFFNHFSNGQNFGQFKLCALSKMERSGNCRSSQGTCKIKQNSDGSWTGEIGSDFHDGGCGGARCSAVCLK